MSLTCLASPIAASRDPVQDLIAAVCQQHVLANKLLASIGLTTTPTELYRAKAELVFAFGMLRTLAEQAERASNGGAA